MGGLRGGGGESLSFAWRTRHGPGTALSLSLPGWPRDNIRPAIAGYGARSNAINRAEFVVVGWTEPEGRRPYLGALLLAYYDPDGKLIYAGMDDAELKRLWRRLQPLATDTMPLDIPPPRGSRFGSPLVLSRVHWVRPELVAEVKFLTWTADNLLRQVVYEGLREDKPARDVRREVPHTK
jgi:bifunctional non-homologous end joining protein LigD